MVSDKTRMRLGFALMIGSPLLIFITRILNEFNLVNNGWLVEVTGWIGTLIVFGVGYFLITRRPNPASKVRIVRPRGQPTGSTLSRPPPLAPDDQDELARLISVLCDFGIFPEDGPPVDKLAAGAADDGPPIVLETVFNGLLAARHFHPDFDAAPYLRNLFFISADIERPAEMIASEAEGLAALPGGGLDIVDLDVKIEANDLITVTATVNDAPFHLHYQGAGKYHEPSLITALARLERSETIRLLGIWTDHGVYVTRLAKDALENLTTALGPQAIETVDLRWLDTADTAQPPADDRDDR